MSIAQNFPLVKPSLLLDFSNTEVLDSRVTFARATTATYYGTRTAKAEENLVLQSAVPYPSPWAWTNGYIGSLGSELVTNGDFSSATGWSGNTGIITGGVAAFVAVAGSIYQSILTVGKRYKLELVVSRFVAAGTFRVRLGGGGTGDLFLNITGTGTYTITGLASADTTFLLISYTTACDFDIDSVSVKEFVQNFVAAPDTTLTASTLVADAANATYLQAVTANAADYTFSVFLRRVTGTGDVQIQAGSGTYVTQTITSTWARYTVTQTLAAGSRTAGIRLVTSGDQVEVWGAQLEQRSSVTAYQVTTTQPITNYIPVLETAASGVARFDHNPTTFESLGLLIEEQRTNLLTYSEQFDNVAWSKSNSTITANTIVAPDGTLTGDVLQANASGGTGVVGLTRNVTITNATHTFSFYAKAKEFSWVAIEISGFTGATVVGSCYYDLANGVVGGFNAIFGTITAVGNGWYRCTGIVTPNSADLLGNFAVYVAEGNNDIVVDKSGTSGIYIWGAQLEAGAFSTSYIPTVASQVTRAADISTISGTNFSSWFNSQQGTVYCSFDSAGIGAPAMAYWEINNASNSVGYVLFRPSGNSTVQTYLGGSPANIGTITANTLQQAIFTYNNISPVTAAGSLNGATPVAISSPSQLSFIPTRISIGSNRTTTESMTGHIRKLSYYPIAATSAQLQALTG